MNALDRRLEAALRITQAAGQMALRRQPPPGAAIADLKGHQDWLTEADGTAARADAALRQANVL